MQSPATPPLVKMRTRAELFRDCLYSEDSILPPPGGSPSSSRTASHSDIGSEGALSPAATSPIRQPVFTLSETNRGSDLLGSNSSNRTDISGYETSDEYCLRTCVNCEEEKYFNSNGAQQCFYCTECEGYVLDACIVAHLVGKVTRLHTLTDDWGRMPNFCWEHKDLVAFYCTDCDVSCCTHCVLSHCTHQFTPIATRRHLQSQTLDTLLRQRAKQEKRLLKKKHQLTAFQADTELLKQQFQSQVQQRFARLREILEQTEKDSLNQIADINSSFDITMKEHCNLKSRSSALKKELELSKRSPKPETDLLQSKNSQLLEDETNALVATQFNLPTLSDLGGEDFEEKFRNSLNASTFFTTGPSVTLCFEAELPTSGKNLSLTNPETPPIRDLAFDPKSQLIYLCRKKQKVVQQYSLQGDLLATISLHQHPWRIAVKDDVLFYTTEPMEGIFTVSLSEPDPRVVRVCSMKCRAFALIERQGLVANRDSRQELIIVDCSTKQMIRSTSHALRDVHYISHDKTSGNIAVSNACDGLVVVFTSQLEVLLAIDARSHKLQWPIGLAYHPSNRTLLIADSDSHRLIQIHTSGDVIRTFPDLNGVALVSFVTSELLVVTSFLNQRVTFIPLTQGDAQGI